MAAKAFPPRVRPWSGSARRAVHIGDTVTTRVEVTSVDLRRGFVGLKTTGLVGGKAVVEGEAVVIVDKRPAEAGG